MPERWSRVRESHGFCSDGSTDCKWGQTHYSPPWQCCVRMCTFVRAPSAANVTIMTRRWNISTADPHCFTVGTGDLTQCLRRRCLHRRRSIQSPVDHRIASVLACGRFQRSSKALGRSSDRAAECGSKYELLLQAMGQAKEQPRARATQLTTTDLVWEAANVSPRRRTLLLGPSAGSGIPLSRPLRCTCVDADVTFPAGAWEPSRYAKVPPTVRNPVPRF